jgi:hypothetical protein
MTREALYLSYNMHMPAIVINVQGESLVVRE